MGLTQYRQMQPGAFQLDNDSDTVSTDALGCRVLFQFFKGKEGVKYMTIICTLVLIYKFYDENISELNRTFQNYVHVFVVQ